jgi:hypothetical protein
MTNQLWGEQQKVAELVAAIERVEAATVERNAAIDAAIALAKRYRVDPPNANSGLAAAIQGQ